MENDTVTNYSYKSEQFREYAERNARQEVYMPPYLLSDYERRTYIRKTIIEDHLHRISSNPAGTEKKFKKIYKSVFYFFRGTAMLYYRDYAGTDMEFPIVFTNGDIHPENFGIMPNKDGVPFFGVNDFDEVCFAPFTYDVRRGAIGFNIGALINGFKKRKRKKIVKKFVTGYLNGLKKFALNEQNGFRSCTLVNMGLVALRLNRELNFDPVKLEFINDEGANRLIDQPMRAPYTI